MTEFLENYITLLELIQFNHLELLKTENFKKVTINLCKGLKLLHSLNIAHNDIKPANIMINNEGKIKYIDFGLSCLNEDCSKKLGGTFPYMDPNILKFEYTILGNFNTLILRFIYKDIDLNRQMQGDLWSLGITIYNMITKNLPINRYKNHYYQYMYFYNYKNDPNKLIIDEYLNDIGSNLNLDKMITTEKKEYSCV